ncbi:MAG: hypothetical protein SPE19_09545, partial [Candidatus Faecousia sp.]|nr:hypothetical protein [Candidatus Faecousia sp.]
LSGVAIPRIEGKCTEKHPKMGTSAIFGGNRYLVPFNRGIATTSVRTGLAMTAFFQTPIYLSGIPAHSGYKRRKLWISRPWIRWRFG